MMTIIQDISQIFYNLAVGIGVVFAGFYYIVGGIGLLFAGIGGFKVFLNWVSDFKEKKRIEKMTLELKEKYPIEEHGKTFELIKSRADPRPVYLLDKNTNIKHWIASRSTFDALEFEFDMVKKLNQKDFDLIETGKKILIE